MFPSRNVTDMVFTFSLMIYFKLIFMGCEIVVKIYVFPQKRTIFPTEFQWKIDDPEVDRQTETDGETDR